jgi:hypothetical protein
MKKTNKQIHSKVVKAFSNSISPKDGRDVYLTAVMNICKERYGIDNKDIERFIRLYSKTGRK